MLLKRDLEPEDRIQKLHEDTISNLRSFGSAHAASQSRRVADLKADPKVDEFAIECEITLQQTAGSDPQLVEFGDLDPKVDELWI